jgi:hypothetical protein
MAGHDAGFEAWWQMNTRATSFERSASSSRAAEMANRESVLRLAVRQAKPASRQAVLVHRAIQRAQDASHFSSSLSSSSKSSSHHDEITSGVQLAELIAAVKRADEPSCSRWVALAAQHDVLDQRAERHRAGGAFLLSAPPLWLAVYSADVALTHQLLGAKADPDVCAAACAGGSGACNVGGQSALHVAVARGASGCVRCLLSHHATVEASFCFGVADNDEPEWDEQTATWVGGLVGTSALQLAAQRSQSAADAFGQICRALLSHGADGSRLQVAAKSRGSMAMPMAPLLQAVRTADGEVLDCPICLSELLVINSVWTPCCVTPFHDHCLGREMTRCPMCRTTLPADLCNV